MLHAGSTSWESQLADKVERYLHDSFGLTARVEPEPLDGLPYFVADTYAVWATDLLGQRTLLLAPRPTTEVSVEEMARHINLVRTRTARPLAILVFDSLSSGRRSAFIDRRMAFMVPLAQLFVPEALLDLKERTPRPPRQGIERFSPTAQLVILGELLRRTPSLANATALAHRYGVATMSMSRAFDELQAAGLADTARSGKSRTLRFHVAGRGLWEAAAPRLQSPVRKVRIVAIPHPEHFRGWLAGESALSRHTDLARPRTTRLAVAASNWNQLARDHALRTCEPGDPSAHEIETWAYDPAALADDSTVDRLSLHLSTREHPDERVAMAADQLLETMSW